MRSVRRCFCMPRASSDMWSYPVGLWLGCFTRRLDLWSVCLSLWRAILWILWNQLKRKRNEKGNDYREARTWQTQEGGACDLYKCQDRDGSVRMAEGHEGQKINKSVYKRHNQGKSRVIIKICMRER